MNRYGYLIAAVATMAVATLATRAFPFLLYRKRQVPEKLLASARLIPGAVMTVLVLTSLIPPEIRTEPAREMALIMQRLIPWGAAGITALVHLLWRHPFFSILAGTVSYMLLGTLVYS